MINWFKREKYTTIEKILLNAFPKALKKDVEVVLAMLPLTVHDIKYAEEQFCKVDDLIGTDVQDVFLDGELLNIPYRVYFNEPDVAKEETLTDQQKLILNCIYLRHHNGYVRYRRLQIIDLNRYWITPFTFQLLGEYVFEIVELLEGRLNDNIFEHYKLFSIENPKYFQQTEQRMISYWNVYYKDKFPKLKSYAGKIIFHLIKRKSIGKRQDEIAEIGIDEKHQLYIKPKKEKFSLIYRTATEVHWDMEKLFLYSPEPREWDYCTWYEHIVRVVDTECNCSLVLTNRTIWLNIDNKLKKQIMNRASF